MRYVDVMTTAGALLAVLVIETQFASAILSVNHMRSLQTTYDCSVEREACDGDATCSACVEAYDASLGACGSSTIDNCYDLGTVLCCASSGCEDNAAYTEVIGCINAGWGCDGGVDSIGVVDSGGVVGGGGYIYSTAPPIIYGAKPIVDGGKPATNSIRQQSVGCYNDGFGCGVLDVSTCTSGGGSASDSGVATDDGTTVTSSSTSLCQAEAEACRADAECVSCADTMVAEETTVGAVCESPGYDQETATCSEKSEVACCFVEEGTNCGVTNAAMAAFLECIAVAEGCDFSPSDCAADDDSYSLVGGDDATSATTDDSWSLSTSDSTTDDSLSLPTSDSTTDDSLSLPTNDSTTDDSWSLPTSDSTTDDSWSLPTNDSTTDDSWSLPTNDSTTDDTWSLSTTDDSTTATTDGTASSMAACQAEQDACLVEGSACYACAKAIAAAANATAAICQDAEYDTATATCSEKAEVACCSVQEGPMCLSEPDELLLAWLDCEAEAQGCEFSIADCADGVDGDDGADGIEAEEDDDQEDADADAADTDSDAAIPSAMTEWRAEQSYRECCLIEASQQKKRTRAR
eukprot:g9396.t1